MARKYPGSLTGAGRWPVAHLCPGMKIILLALGFLGLLLEHDFFVSILTIRHLPTTRTLDLTWRMTAHDVEHVLSDRATLQLGSAHEHPKADSLLNAYFMEHLALSRNGEPLTWAWVGKELDGETLYAYLQVDSISTPEGLVVTNTLLQDVFGEQQNLVHVEGGGLPVRSHTFVRGGAPYTFSW